METPFVRATSARDPLIGCVLHDRYRVQKRIGKGGMGIVYLAEHVLLRRKVALKTISDRAFASDEQVARFHREAMAAAAVGSDHIVGVTDMGQLDDGSYFIVLEYLDGVELAFAVASEGPLPLSRALRIVSQLCDALTAVHAAGIVHRDLKPENLFLIERDGAPDFLKVLDFGVCKFFEHGPQGNRSLTHTGATLGTPEFMAPEQVEGGTADTRADIHAAGAILYFALTGEAPFQSASLPQLFMRISSEPSPSLHARRPDLPPALDAVIARALQKRPEDRYQTCAELRAALAPFATASADTRDARASRARFDSTSAIAHSLLRRASWRPRRARTYGIVLVCLLLALLAGLSSAALRRRSASARAWSSDAAHSLPRNPTRTSRRAVPATAMAPLQPSGDMRVADPVHSSVANDPLGAATEPPPTEQPETRISRARHSHALGPVVPSTQAPATPTSSTTPHAPDQTDPAPTPPDNSYRLSQRGLKDVF